LPDRQHSSGTGTTWTGTSGTGTAGTGTAGTGTTLTADLVRFMSGAGVMKAAAQGAVGAAR
jgi:hypothetical protein